MLSMYDVHTFLINILSFLTSFVSQSPIMSAIPSQLNINDYVDEFVGGPVWKRIVANEAKYWESVLSDSHYRPDACNPVGGLIDITDF